MFFTSSKSVFTDIMFLKYFVGLSLSSFGASGVVVKSGPTCIKSPSIAINIASARIGPIIKIVGTSVINSDKAANNLQMLVWNLLIAKHKEPGNLVKNKRRKFCDCKKHYNHGYSHWKIFWFYNPGLLFLLFLVFGAMPQTACLHHPSDGFLNIL